MKTLILYQPKSEHARVAEEYAHDFTWQHPERQVELVSLDTVQGSDLAQLYDILQYPALLVLNDGGELLKYWEGDPLPLMDEVASYAQQ